MHRTQKGGQHVERLKKLDRMIKTSRKWSKFPLKSDPSELSMVLSNSKSQASITRETVFENNSIAAKGSRTNRLFEGFITPADLQASEPLGFHRFVCFKFDQSVRGRGYL